MILTETLTLARQAPQTETDPTDSGCQAQSTDLKTGLQPDAGMISRSSIGVASICTKLTLGIALGLGSCATPPSTPGSGSPQVQSPTTGATSATTDELQIVTTFVPMSQFTKAVVGDRAEVTQLLPTNVGPHDYQAKPEDVQKLANADVLVQNGLGMEEFLEDMVENAENDQLTVIDSSQGIPTIATKTIVGETHEGETHEGETHETEAEHEHGEFNPHIWLDPKLAIQQVETIRDGLIAVDPEGQEIYTANAAAYIQKLRDLDAETTKLLQPYGGKTFVAFHDFAPYFAQSYNLKVTFLVDVPEENPSPDDVKRVMDTVQGTNLKTLLTEPQGGEDAFASLAKDLQVQVSTFDPMETGSAEAIQPDYYLTTMRQNVTTLLTAFTGQSPQSFRPVWLPQSAIVLPQRVGVRF